MREVKVTGFFQRYRCTTQRGAMASPGSRAKCRLCQADLSAENRPKFCPDTGAKLSKSQFPQYCFHCGSENEMMRNDSVIMDAVTRNTYIDAIRTRFCLLIYGEGNSKDEGSVFMSDCKLLKRALTKFHKEKDMSNSHVLPAEEAEERFLELIVKREQQIAEKLSLSLVNIFPNCCAEAEGKQLLLDMLIRIRLLKAMESTIDVWSDRYSGLEGLDSGNSHNVFKILLAKWKKASENPDPSTQAKNLTTNKRLLCSEGNRDLDNFQKECLGAIKKCGMKLKFPTDNERLNSVAFADEIFSTSLYQSGFPRHAEALAHEKYAPFFDNYNNIQSVLKTSVTASTLKTKFLQLVQLLADWKEVKTEQWIWIHYSGHGRGGLVQKESFRNLNDMIALSCDLFTQVVVSLDCCNPEYCLPALPLQGLYLILPNSRYSKSYHGDIHSDFTYHLYFALRGFQYEQCFSWKLFPSCSFNFQTCYTGTCSNYDSRVTENRYSESGVAQQKNITSCALCKTLWDECYQTGFILIGHVDRYLKDHLCNLSYWPWATSVEQENMEMPLMRWEHR